ncbi:MAG: hypothetical protein ACI88S_000678 [Ilumatobacter sp.]
MVAFFRPRIREIDPHTCKRVEWDPKQKSEDISVDRADVWQRVVLDGVEYCHYTWCVDFDPNDRSARIGAGHVDGAFAAAEADVEDHGAPTEHFIPVEQFAALVETPPLEPRVELGLALL